MKSKIFALAFGILAVPAQAEVQNYECDVHSIQTQGWIPPRILLSVDPEAKRARAYDGWIAESNELEGVHENTPADAKFKTTRKGNYQMVWRITLRASSGRQFRVNYTGTLDPKTNKLNLIARFPMDNLSNRPKGVGQCKLIKSPTLF